MKITFNDRFDSLIQYHCERLAFPFPWILIKAQCRQESAFKPNAQSPVGAKGLLQLMPATDQAIDGDIDGFDIEGNLDNGIRYLAEQFRHFPEIPLPDERMKFALASYNGGRGYINAALKLAYMFEKGINTVVKPMGPGEWQTWGFTKQYLEHPGCSVNGRHPDHQQIWDYVDKIWGFYQEFK